MPRKRILLLTKHFLPDLGGTEIYNKNILEFLKTKDDVEITVITFQPGQMKKKLPKITIDNNVKIVRLGLSTTNTVKVYYLLDLPIPRFIKNLIIYTQLFFINIFHFSYFTIKSFLYLAKNRVDVIYTVGGIFAATVGAILSIICRKKIVFHLHCDFQLHKMFSIAKRIISFFFRKGDYILVNSLDIKKDLVLLGVEKSKIATIKNWADFSIFRPLNKNECRRKLQLPINKFIFLFATSLNKIKFVDLVLDAIDELKDNKDFLFLFIGDGPFKNKVESYQNKYSNVIYYGPIENNRLSLYINSADISWGVCDVYYISLNAIESLSCTVPVIACNISATLRMKVAPKTLPSSVGFLVSRNSKEISNILLWLNTNKNVLEQKKKNCLPFVSREYGFNNAEKVYKMLSSL